LPPLPPEPTAPLDPSAPLDPWNDLGVDWPDMETQDAAIPDVPETGIADAGEGRTYSYRIEGLSGVDTAGLLR
jgi:hypothetical protein